MRTVLLFPGQSSRYAGALRKLATARPDVVTPLFARAEALLGRRVHEFDQPGAQRNLEIQISVFLANQAFAEILRAEGVDGDASIGLSLGEYNRLLHIGALAFDDALRLVAARGAAYDQGPLGAMGEVFPVEEAAVLDAIERSRALGSVEIANFNSPSQFVVAGDRAAVDAVLAILGDEYAAAGVIIDERLPMHCSLFAEVADRFRPALAAAPIGVPRTAYVPNVLGRLLDAAAPSRIRHLLVGHVHQPVRFRQGVDALAERYPGAAFVEVGPKQVIYNLLTKKWGGFRRFRTDVEETDIATSTAALVRELRHAA